MNLLTPNPFIENSTLLVRTEIEKKGDEVVAIHQFYRHNQGKTYARTPANTKERKYTQSIKIYDKDNNETTSSDESSFQVIWQWELQ